MSEIAKAISRNNNVTTPEVSDKNKIDPFSFIATVRDLLLQSHPILNCKLINSDKCLARTGSNTSSFFFNDVICNIDSLLKYKTSFNFMKNLLSDMSEENEFAKSPDSKSTKAFELEKHKHADEFNPYDLSTEALNNISSTQFSTPNFADCKNSRTIKFDEFSCSQPKDERCNANILSLCNSNDLVNKMFNSLRLLMHYIIALQIRQKYSNDSSLTNNTFTNSVNQKTLPFQEKHERLYYEIVVTTLLTSLIDILDCLLKTFIILHNAENQPEDEISHSIVIHKCQCIILGTIKYLQQVCFDSAGSYSIDLQKDLPILSDIIILCSLLQKNDSTQVKQNLNLDLDYTSKISDILWSLFNDKSSATNNFNKSDNKPVDTSEYSNSVKHSIKDGCYAFDAQLKTHKTPNGLNTGNANNNGRGFRRSSTEYLCTYPGVSWNTRMQSWLVYYEDAKGRKSRTFNPKRLTSSQLSVLPTQLRLKYAKDPVVTAMHCACAFAAKVRWEGKVRKSLCLHGNRSFQTPTRTNFCPCDTEKSNSRQIISSKNCVSGDSFSQINSFHHSSSSNDNLKTDELTLSEHDSTSNTRDSSQCSDIKDYTKFSKISSISQSTQLSDISSQNEFLTNDLTTNQLLAIGLNTYVEGTTKRRRRENNKMK